MQIIEDLHLSIAHSVFTVVRSEISETRQPVATPRAAARSAGVASIGQ